MYIRVCINILSIIKVCEIIVLVSFNCMFLVKHTLKQIWDFNLNVRINTFT